MCQNNSKLLYKILTDEEYRKVMSLEYPNSAPFYGTDKGSMSGKVWYVKLGELPSEHNVIKVIKHQWLTVVEDGAKKLILCEKYQAQLKSEQKIRNIK